MFVNSKKKPKVLVILGPTASGKTALGVRLASKLNGEIISADSRQVFRGMDIGTGKDLGEYVIREQLVPYHLIDIVNPNTSFNLAKYQRLASVAIKEILERNNLPILVGGSGLYLQAVVDNFTLAKGKSDLKLRSELEALGAEDLLDQLKKQNPEFACKLNNSDSHNARRLARYLEISSEGRLGEIGKQEAKYDFLILGTYRPGEELRSRIGRRLRDRLEKEGLVEEIKSLHQKGISWKRLIYFGLEYKFVSWFLMGKLDYDTMVFRLETEICQFAKRQKSWFKRWEGQGTKINWVSDEDEAKLLINQWLNN
ncbi:MAG: tRNA (adenosine(37)-N6)-dimethylallyltransferase MiaA [Patescibacteria group bacterium]